MAGLEDLLEGVKPSCRAPGWRDVHPADPPFWLVYVRKEALLSSPDRRHRVLSVGSAAVRERGGAGRSPRRCPGSVELRRRHDPRSEPASRWFPAVATPHQGDPPGSSRQGPGQRPGDPGSFASSQNWVGGTPHRQRSLCPAAARTSSRRAWASLETFLHSQASDIPLLIKAGLVHLQFESIHPFPGRQRTL